MSHNRLGLLTLLYCTSLICKSDCESKNKNKPERKKKEEREKHPRFLPWRRCARNCKTAGAAPKVSKKFGQLQWVYIA